MGLVTSKGLGEGPSDPLRAAGLRRVGDSQDAWLGVAVTTATGLELSLPRPPPSVRLWVRAPWVLGACGRSLPHVPGVCLLLL